MSAPLKAGLALEPVDPTLLGCPPAETLLPPEARDTSISLSESSIPKEAWSSHLLEIAPRCGSFASQICADRALSSDEPIYLFETLKCDFPVGTQWTYLGGELNYWKGILSGDHTYAGIKFEKGDVIWLDPTGQLLKASFTSDRTIHFVPFTKDWPVNFHPNGQLKAATLSEDLTLQGVDFPEGSILTFDEDGRVQSALLGDDTEIQGIPFSEQHTVSAETGFLTNWRFGWSFAVIGEVTFYESGELKSGTLSEKHTIDGIEFPEWTRIQLDKHGHLFETKLKISGSPIPKGSVVEDLKNGSVAVTLSMDAQVNRIHFNAKTWLIADKERKLERAILRDDASIQGTTFHNNDRITFDRDGRLLQADFIGSREIEEIPAELVTFHKNGRLQSAILASDTVIQGIPFTRVAQETRDNAGQRTWTLTKVEFDEKGKLITQNECQAQDPD